jgi:hypothetical protein
VPPESAASVSRRTTAASIQDDNDYDEDEDLDFAAPGAYAVSMVHAIDQLRPDSESAWDPTDQPQDTIETEQHFESADPLAAAQNDVENSSSVACRTTNDTNGEHNAPGGELPSLGRKGKGWRARRYPLCLLVSMVLAACAVGVTLGLVLTTKSTGGGANSTTSDGCSSTTTQEDLFLQCECTGQIQVSSGSRSDHVQYVYNSLLASGELVDFVGDQEMQFESCTSKNRALVWLALEIANAEDAGVTYPYSRIQDRVVVASFFEALGGRSWYEHTNWMSNTSVCSWFGIGCDKEGKVTSLSLPKNNVEGSLETILGLLQDLKTLDLSQNLIAGSIPQNIWSLPRLGEKSATHIHICLFLDTQSLTLCFLRKFISWSKQTRRNVAISIREFHFLFPTSFGPYAAFRTPLYFFRLASNTQGTKHFGNTVGRINPI